MHFMLCKKEMVTYFIVATDQNMWFVNYEKKKVLVRAPDSDNEEVSDVAQYAYIKKNQHFEFI